MGEAFQPHKTKFSILHISLVMKKVSTPNFKFQCHM